MALELNENTKVVMTVGGLCLGAGFFVSAGFFGASIKKDIENLVDNTADMKLLMKEEADDARRQREEIASRVTALESDVTAIKVKLEK